MDIFHISSQVYDGNRVRVDFGRPDPPTYFEFTLNVLEGARLQVVDALGRLPILDLLPSAETRAIVLMAYGHHALFANRFDVNFYPPQLWQTALGELARTLQDGLLSALAGGVEDGRAAGRLSATRRMVMSNRLKFGIRSFAYRDDANGAPVYGIMAPADMDALEVVYAEQARLLRLPNVPK
jgi:hypothetical protein